jgi:hypothetical protein
MCAGGRKGRRGQLGHWRRPVGVSVSGLPSSFSDTATSKDG